MYPSISFNKVKDAHGADALDLAIQPKLFVRFRRENKGFQPPWWVGQAHPQPCIDNILHHYWRLLMLHYALQQCLQSLPYALQM